MGGFFPSFSFLKKKLGGVGYDEEMIGVREKEKKKKRKKKLFIKENRCIEFERKKKKKSSLSHAGKAPAAKFFFLYFSGRQG